MIRPVSYMHFFTPVLVLILTMTALYPALQNDFTNWDDSYYVLENQHIHSLSAENLKYIFTQPHMGHYHPLAMLSLNIDYLIDGFNPFVFHLTNLLFHLINTLLVWRLVLLLFNRRLLAFAASALFGIHTLNVEAVVWISERKDVLYTLFYLLSLISYVAYCRSKKIKHIWITALYFILSCLSKEQGVTLTFSFFLIDYLEKRNLFNRQVIIEKIPFVLLSVFFGVLGILTQKTSDAMTMNIYFSFIERIAFASYGFCQYLIRSVVPLNLSSYYPYPLKPEGQIPSYYWFYILPALAIAVLVIWLIIKKRRMEVFCSLFFILNIAPMLQLIPIGHVLMADRYMYVPGIGLWILAGYGLDRLFERTKNMAVLVGSVFILFITITTHARSKIWKDSITLWDDVLSKYTYVLDAWNNRGIARKDKKDYEGAMSDYHQALRINPQNYQAFNNKANLFYVLNDYRSALNNYDSAIKYNPQFALTFKNRGVVKFILKDFAGAAEDFRKALEIEPGFAEAKKYLDMVPAESEYETENRKGLELEAQGKNTEALAAFMRARQLNPQSPESFYNIGNLYGKLGNFAKAIYAFDTAIALYPDYAEAYSNRGIARAQKGDINGAISDFNQAITLKPQFANAYFNRAISYLNSNRKELACADLSKASELGHTAATEIFKNTCSSK